MRSTQRSASRSRHPRRGRRAGPSRVGPAAEKPSPEISRRNCDHEVEPAVESSPDKVSQNQAISSSLALLGPGALRSDQRDQRRAHDDRYHSARERRAVDRSTADRPRSESPTEYQGHRYRWRQEQPGDYGRALDAPKHDTEEHGHQRPPAGDRPGVERAPAGDRVVTWYLHVPSIAHPQAAVRLAFSSAPLCRPLPNTLAGGDVGTARPPFVRLAARRPG